MLFLTGKVSGEAVEVDLTGGYALDGLGVEGVFSFEDAGGEGVGGVVGHDRDFGLGYHGASVIFFVHEVDADAGDACACGKHRRVDALAVHSLSAEFGQKGWVDIQDAVVVSAQRPGAKFPHVPSQGDEFDSVRGQGIGDGGVQTRRVRVGDRAEVGGGDIRASGAFQAMGAGVVGDDHADFGVEGTFRAGVNDGLEIRATVRGKDSDRQLSDWCLTAHGGLVRADFLGFHDEFVHL